MAADAPGIQIEAINPRKAELELQPNVSRPAITRPSPANCQWQSEFFPSGIIDHLRYSCIRSERERLGRDFNAILINPFHSTASSGMKNMTFRTFGTIPGQKTTKNVESNVKF